MALQKPLGDVPIASAIVARGLYLLPDNCERYHVEAGGLLCLPVEEGDSFQVINEQGMQVCQLSVFDAAGVCDFSVLNGVKPDTHAATFLASLREDDRLKRFCVRYRLDIAKVKALQLFTEVTFAGTRQDFKVARNGILIVAVPPSRMLVDQHNTATPIIVYVERIRSRRGAEAPLPEPLADILQDIRVDSATARAFTVKKGEYIQIIDVEGKQCSDFQAFCQRKLDQGKALPLDATITRSLMGVSLPQPGLPAKAFDLEMLPLVELIQDTALRHDSFVSACNSRYYDSMGYPGHVNCTDNFNRALDPFGIPARRGWEALNYFFNTNINANNQIYFDEPCTRPGDYVMMRALTDIVCVASACPCDIDAANGWNPTDIHVRTYADKENFRKGRGFRMTENSDAVITRETGFHKCFAQYTRNFIEYGGYWLANEFNDGGAAAEYHACRHKAIITDLSPLRKYEVTGPDAEKLLDYCLTRNIRKLADGDVVYTAMCYEHGGMLDDGTVYRLAKNNFRWVGGSDISGIHMREVAESLKLKCWVRSSTEQLHNIAVQGPNSRDILKQIIWTPPDRETLQEIKWFRFTVGRIDNANGTPVVVSRTGYSGELGYEIFCHPKDAETIFNAVLEAGKPYGLKPLGLAALDMLRIEAGLIFAGYEFSDETDPFEAGIGFTVALKTKQEDFIGKSALIRRKQNPTRKLVGLDISSEEEVAGEDSIHIGRAQIGSVTSAMRSPTLNKQIALARIDINHSCNNTEVEIGRIDGKSKRIPAKIVPFPHYDPQKLKPRS